MIANNMCLMVSSNVLGGELVSSKGSNICLMARYNMLDGRLVSSGDEKYVLVDELPHAG